MNVGIPPESSKEKPPMLSAPGFEIAAVYVPEDTDIL